MSSLNYTHLPENMTIYSPLDKDSVIEMEDLREKTITDLFGQEMNALKEKHQYKMTLKIAALSVAPFSALTGIGLIFYSPEAGLYVGAPFSFIMSLATFFGSGFLWQESESFKKIFYSGFPQALTVFYNEFEAFKNNPQEIQVPFLIRKFVKITSKYEIVKEMKEMELVDKQELYFFGEVGRLFLIDALVSLLKGNNEKDGNKNSTFIEYWDILSKNPNDLNFTSYNDYVWESLKIPSPKMKSYQIFYNYRTTFQSVLIADKIKELFKRALDEYLKK